MSASKKLHLITLITGCSGFGICNLYQRSLCLRFFDNVIDVRKKHKVRQSSKSCESVAIATLTGWFVNTVGALVVAYFVVPGAFRFASRRI